MPVTPLGHIASKIELFNTDRWQNCWVDRGKVLTPEIDREKDLYKVLGTKVRFLKKSRKKD